MTNIANYVAADIESAFRAGSRAVELAEVPYPADSLLHHWWTRGYAHRARLTRAYHAEQRAELLEAAVRAYLAAYDCNGLTHPSEAEREELDRLRALVTPAVQS